MQGKQWLMIFDPSFRTGVFEARSHANSPRNGRANGDRMGFGELGPGNGADR